MADRRPLVDGLKPTAPAVDPQREREFVFQGKPPEPVKPVVAAATSLNRVPISTRMRGDFAAALKRASLERQLNGVEPNSLQDILENAVEPWLRSNGYIS